MIAATIIAQAGALAEARARASLLAAAAELPGITAAAHPAGVRLTATHLHARVFGSRHQRRDPRLALFVGPTR